MSQPYDIGLRLRHAREDQGFSQAALAQGICAPSSISRWESGLGQPDDTVLKELAHRLGISIETLTGRGFDAQIAESVNGVDALLTVAFPLDDTGQPHLDPTHAHASWISLARSAMMLLDPWRSYTQDPTEHTDDLYGRLSIEDDLEQAVAQLAADHISLVAPRAAHIVEILQAMVEVKNAVTAHALERLTETIKVASDAPEWFRLMAVETVVCGYALAHHSNAAITKTANILSHGNLGTITYTTHCVLQAIQKSHVSDYAVRRLLSTRDCMILRLQCEQSLSESDQQFDAVHAIFGDIGQEPPELSDSLPAILNEAGLLPSP